MSSMTVTIGSPTYNAQVSRTFTVSGSISLAATSGRSLISRSVSVQFGDGAPWKLATLSGTAWQCSGEPLPAVPPGATFTVYASARASFRYYHRPGEPDFEDVAAQTSVVVHLPPPIAPTLTIDAFPAEIVTDQYPVAFTLAGATLDPDSAVSLVQCALDVGPFAPVENVSGTWSRWRQPFSLQAGLHRFVVQAVDSGGNRSDVVRTLHIRPSVEPPDPGTGSITSWTRLEPRGVVSDLGRSASARVFDPLWLLTRQWQLGEFQGEDAGTPVLADLNSYSTMLTRAHLGELPPGPFYYGPPVPYDPLQKPLEAVVESRSMRALDADDPRMLPLAVEAGLHFLHMLERRTLSKSYRAALLARFALQPLATSGTVADDPATTRFLQTMVGRAPDARRLAVALRGGAAAQLVLEPALAIAAADRPVVQQCALEWLAWYDALFGAPATAPRDPWNPERMEYSLSVAARTPLQEMVLTAAEFDGGRLDWSSFDRDSSRVMGAANDNQVVVANETTVPAPVSFRGAPAQRFWEIEDNGVAYGLLPAGPSDLGQLLMAEYASSYGNDWFVVPLELPVGSITLINSLIVTDTFGVRKSLRPIGWLDSSPEWSMWQLASRNPDGTQPHKSGLINNFFLAPTLGRVIESAPLEEVLLLRDEMANVAWGIERTVEGPLEQPLQRRPERGVVAEEAPPVAPASSDAAPRYLLSSTVPENWVPLLPVQIRTAPDKVVARLKRGAVLQPDGSGRIHPAEGQLLNARPELLLYDEEVPREGALVTKSRRMARWVDGSTSVWTAFRKRVGRGEGSSGLQFDQLRAPTRE